MAFGNGVAVFVDGGRKSGSVFRKQGFYHGCTVYATDDPTLLFFPSYVVNFQKRFISAVFSHSLPKLMVEELSPVPLELKVPVNSLRSLSCKKTVTHIADKGKLQEAAALASLWHGQGACPGRRLLPQAWALSHCKKPTVDGHGGHAAGTRNGCLI